MNEKTNRNDPCPCGSGKKYKKCCGLKEVASITTVIEREIDDLQHELLSYALNHFDAEIEDDFEELEEAITIEDEKEANFYMLTHTIWFSCFVRLEDGETILEKFVREAAKKSKRPKTKEILLSWSEGVRTIAGTILRSEKDELTIEDMLNGESHDALLLTKVPDLREGEFFLGTLLPYEQKYVFFPIPYAPGNIDSQQVEKYIVESAKNFGYDSPQEFLTEHFLELLNELPSIGLSVDLDDLDWPSPVQKVTAELFKKMSEDAADPEDVTEYGIMLWYQFCRSKNKRIQAPMVYAATVHYLAYFVRPGMNVTQREIAERYGVAANRISTLSTEIIDVLDEEFKGDSQSSHPDAKQWRPQAANPIFAEQEMQKLMAELNQHEFENVEEVNAFISARLNAPQGAVKKETRSKKEEAQDLIYEALEASGKKRYKLAQDALRLNPNHADAYNILAEKATSPEEAARLYKQGMEGGQKELGKSFIMQNKGHFWGIFETRPYMRAKKNYADTLIRIGKTEEGIREYEDLLALNPNDNQGVRDDLFIAYMDESNFKSAQRLLDMYEEETTTGILNSLLLEISEKGFTAKASTLLKKAKKQNKFVLNYLTGKKKLPTQLPDYYGFGDENEAIVYAYAHQHLWRKIDGLKEWLK